MPESTTAPKDHVEALTEKIDLILLGYYGGLLPTAAHEALADVQSRLPSLLEGMRAAERERLAARAATVCDELRGVPPYHGLEAISTAWVVGRIRTITADDE